MVARCWFSLKEKSNRSPILMTLLLVKVSGVSMLEQTMRMKPGYEEYLEKTSAFIPWFPRR
jgi:steroid 5-alpha reductase family enzyme